MIRPNDDNLRNSQMEIYIPEAAAKPEFSEPNTMRYLEVILRRRWTIILTLLAVMTLGMLYTLTRKPRYESTAELVVLSSSGTTAVAGNDVPILGDLQALTRSRSVETQVQLVSSPGLVKEAFDSLEPQLRTQGFNSGDVPEWTHEVIAKRNTDIVAVTARAYTPRAAAEFANSIVRTYFARDMSQSARVTRQARLFTGERMEKVGLQLAEANAQLARFKEQTGLFAPEAQLTETAQQMARLSSDMETAKAEQAGSQREAEALRQQLRKAEQDVISSTTVARNPRFDALVSSIDNLNSQRAALLQEYVPGSREVKSVEDRIRREEAKLKQIAASVVSAKVESRSPTWDTLVTRYSTQVASAAAASARLSALRSQMTLNQAASSSLPEKERELSERLQRVAILQSDYESLSNKYRALLLREQAAVPSGILVSEAAIPEKPVYPNPKNSALFFLLLGTVLALFAAMIIEWQDIRVHDQHVTEQISRLATLSIVPEVSGRLPLLLDTTISDPAVLESFRILRNNVRISGLERKLKIIAVTSPSRADGKSTTAVNLAVAMGMEGRNVLLVDGDLRRPSLHNLLNVSRDRGVTTVVTGASTLEQAVTPTQIDHVFCLPAGPTPPNPPELLNSQPSRELFKQLGELYDTVIVDCPPSTGLSDIGVISTIVDGVLLVVSMNGTLKPHLEITMRSLTQAGAPLVGLVANRANVKYRGGGYYDYCNCEPKSVGEIDSDRKPEVKTK